MLGVLVTAGAAICLAPCGSALAEWNLGQAINAVTGTRLWAFVFSLPGTVLILLCCFVLRGCRQRHSAGTALVGFEVYRRHAEQERGAKAEPLVSHSQFELTGEMASETCAPV